MKTEFAGATLEELRQASLGARAVGMAKQDELFPHHGQAKLDQDSLDLGGWLTVTADTVRSVRQEFIPEYTRSQAGGVRGGFPSLGFIKKLGAPIIVERKDGTTLVLLFGFGVVGGSTKNAHWLEALQSTWVLK